MEDTQLQKVALHLEGSIGSTTIETHEIPTPPKITFDPLEQAFLAQE